MATVSFSPQPTVVRVVGAPPGQDWLELHVQVTNLLTDRSAVFNGGLIALFAPCSSPDAGILGVAPNGQCRVGDPTDETAIPGWGVDYCITPDSTCYNTADDITNGSGIFTIAGGAAADFYCAVQIDEHEQYTAWTMWVGAANNGIPWTGGVHVLSAAR